MADQKLTDRYPDKHIVDCKISLPRKPDTKRRGREFLRVEATATPNLARLLAILLISDDKHDALIGNWLTELNNLPDNISTDPRTVERSIDQMLPLEPA